jgi:putative phosphoserine phosphatase/1-acylglycerol-3-phosphate O-acyltransferase
LFQAADRVLRRTGESACLSPEGQVTLGGAIGPFNKGAFHLAASLGAPIVPLYIAIPRAVDPGEGRYLPEVRPGTVRVYRQPAIATREWKIEDLDHHRREVRAAFVQLNERLNPRRYTLCSASWTQPIA